MSKSAIDQGLAQLTAISVVGRGVVFLEIRVFLVVLRHRFTGFLAQHSLGIIGQTEVGFVLNQVVCRWQHSDVKGERGRNVDGRADALGHLQVHSHGNDVNGVSRLVDRHAGVSRDCDGFKEA